ncbi:hypothetical protein [Streptomyces sp. NPDC055036]
MAEAKKTIVKKLVTSTQEVPAFTLTLSKEEAEALMVLTGSISGDGSLSPRKHTDAVYRALSRAGVVTWDKPVARQLSSTMRWLTDPKPQYDI